MKPLYVIRVRGESAYAGHYLTGDSRRPDRPSTDISKARVFDKLTEAKRVKKATEAIVLLPGDCEIIQIGGKRKPTAKGEK